MRRDKALHRVLWRMQPPPVSVPLSLPVFVIHGLHPAAFRRTPLKCWATRHPGSAPLPVSALCSSGWRTAAFSSPLAQFAKNSPRCLCVFVQFVVAAPVHFKNSRVAVHSWRVTTTPAEAPDFSPAKTGGTMLCNEPHAGFTSHSFRAMHPGIESLS